MIGKYLHMVGDAISATVSNDGTFSLPKSNPGPGLKASTIREAENYKPPRFEGFPRNEKCPCGSGKKYKKCCYLRRG